MKIGDRFWIKQANGVWYEERVIVGETSRSWVTVNVGASSQWKEPNGYAAWYVKRYATKVPKKGADIADAKTAMQSNWSFNNRYKLSDVVERCWEPITLLAIAKLVGFEIPEEING